MSKLLRKIVISIVTILVLYIVGWFSFATYLEKKISTVITEQANSNLKIIGTPEVKISGFPFDFKVTLNKPHFAYNSGQVNYDVAFGGNFTLSTDLLVKSFKLVSDGGALITITQGGNKLTLIADAEKNTVYNVALRYSPLSQDGLKFIFSALDQPEKMLYLLKNIQLKTNNAYIKTSAGDKIFTSDKCELKISPDIDQNIDLDAKITLKNTQFFASSARLWQLLLNTPSFAETYSSLSTEVRNYLTIFNPVTLGNMNYMAKIAYTKENEEFKLKIKELDLNDQIHQINLNGSISGDADLLSLDLQTVSKFNNTWYQLMQNYAQSFITTSKPSQKGGIARLFADLKNKLLSHNKQVYMAYVPRLHDYGNIALNLAMDISTKQQVNYKISSFDFKVIPYSLSLNGQYTEQGTNNSYDGTAQLHNYQAIFEDAFNYADRISRAMGKKLMLGDSTFTLSTKSRTQIIEFITTVADKVTTNDLAIKTSKSLNNKYPAIGRYSADEFATIWNQFWMQLVLDETTDKVKKMLPPELQEKVQREVDKIAPLKEVLSLLR